jgi:hypothetical protein
MPGKDSARRPQKSYAVAFPMPLGPPVKIATFPDNFPWLLGG